MNISILELGRDTGQTDRRQTDGRKDGQTPAIIL